MYIFNKKTKMIYETNDFVIINPLDMKRALEKHNDDIKNLYGYLTLDDNGLLVYVPYKIPIKVSPDNDVIRVRSHQIDDKDNIRVDKKEYFTNWYKLFNDDRTINENKVMKYFEGKFYVLDKSYIDEYDPKTNTMKINIDKYKEYLKEKIANSEEEVRYRGYPYTFWEDELFAQPFRDSTNDLGIFKSTKEDIPVKYRKIKLFNLVGKDRLTTVGTYKWLVGEDVTNLFLEYQILLLNAYAGAVKDAIYQMTLYIGSVNDLNTLKNIELNYVDIMINNMSKIIESKVELMTLKNQVALDFASKGIKPRENIKNIL